MTSPLPGPSSPPEEHATADAFLGGKLSILQPRHGYRAGVDAVLLAAAVPLGRDTPADVLDCGSGVGTVGLCLAARCRGARVTLVEREAELLHLARANIARNGLESRTEAVAGDLTLAAQNPGSPRIESERFDVVLANPPFHNSACGTRAKDRLKSVSHAMESDALDLWIRFAVRVMRPSGRLVLIHKAAALPLLLPALEGRFGGLRIRPVHPQADAPAMRVLVDGIKGSRAETVLLPGLVLHEPGGAFTPYVSRILREGASLDPAHDPPTETD